jgi:hypothetical protein
VFLFLFFLSLLIFLSSRGCVEIWCAKRTPKYQEYFPIWYICICTVKFTSSFCITYSYVFRVYSPRVFVPVLLRYSFGFRFLGSESIFNRPVNNGAQNVAHMSQNVDTVINSCDPHDVDNALAPLLQRSLRQRGLSDSSIHSMFMTQAEEPQPLSV